MSQQNKAERVQSDDDGRRTLIRGTMASLAALTLGSVVAACSDDDGSGSATDAGNRDAGSTDRDAGGKADAGTTGEDAGSAPVDADIAPLNALLTAEYSAIAAYKAGAGLIEGAPESDPLAPLRAVILSIATDIAGQHTAHAAALVADIERLGGSAVKAADVTFTPPQALLDKPTILNVLKLAAGAERGAAVAYNQTVERLEAARTRFLAGAIEGDETQHFIVLTALVAGLVKPGSALTVDSADAVFPEPFVSKVGDDQGLAAVPDYFA